MTVTYNTPPKAPEPRGLPFDHLLLGVVYKLATPEAQYKNTRFYRLNSTVTLFIEHADGAPEFGAFFTVAGDGFKRDSYSFIPADESITINLP